MNGEAVYLGEGAFDASEYDFCFVTVNFVG